MEKKNRNPVLVLTGLAIVAVAVVAGLTRDKWLGDAPVITAELTPATEPPASAEPVPETAAQSMAEGKTQPEPPPAAAEQPAASEQAAETEQPKVAEPAPEAAPAETEQPKVAEPAPEAVPAETEQPKMAEPAPEAAPAETEQPKVAEPSPEAAAAETEQPKVAESAPEAAPAETEQPKLSEPAPEAADAMTEAPPAADASAKTQVPAFDTVRVEKTGEAVIAGTAAPGAEVVVKLDGSEIGRTKANSGGAFVVIPDQPLPAGVGAITIEAKAKGEPVPTASEQTVAVVVPEQANQQTVVAVVSPSAPTKVLQKPESEPAPEQVAAVEPEPEAPAMTKPAAPATRQVTLDAVDYDDAGNIVFSGQGEPGQDARIYVDNAHAGDAAIAADGHWAFAGTAAIAVGVHQLRVDGIDAAGKVVNRIEVPFYREEQNKVANIEVPDQTVAKSIELQTPPAATAEAGAEVAAAATAAPRLPREGRVVIQPGNNLWRISRVLYGTGTKFTVIYEANKDQIRDPDMIFPGQVFMTPDVVPPGETVDPSRREPLTPEETSSSAQ